MAAKKDRGRFNIRLNENDPAHEAVIRLLEKQPSHGKAQLVMVQGAVGIPDSSQR